MLRDLFSQKFLFKTQNFIFLSIGFLLFLFLSVVISRIAYPFENGHYEAFNLIPASQLLEGKNPYAFAFTPPYSMSPYGIVFYALLAAGLKLFGFQLWFGRSLSVLAYIVCFGLMIKITKRLTTSREAALAAGIFFLVMFPGQYWIGIIRPDLIAMALGLTAFWKALSFEESRQIGFWSILAIALLASAAIFTKQTFWMPVIFIVWRFIQLGKWQEALYFTAACAILVTGGMLALNYTSDGGHFWQHFTHARTLPFSIKYSIVWILQILELPTTVIFLVFLFLVLDLNHQLFDRLKKENLLSRWRSPNLLIFSYLLLSFVWNSLSSGRIGASLNYYLEASFLLALAGGLIYANFKKSSFPRLATAMLILLTFGGILQLIRISEKEYFRWKVSNYYQELEDTVGRLITPESICVSVYADIVMRSGCSLNFDDIGEYSSGWSPELDHIFEREARAGRYQVIILHEDDFHKRFPNYRPVLMSQPVPPGDNYSKAFLYVRSDEPVQ